MEYPITFDYGNQETAVVTIATHDKLIVIVDAKFFAQFQRFLQTQFHLLAFVIHTGCRFCQVNS